MHTLPDSPPGSPVILARSVILLWIGLLLSAAVAGAVSPEAASLRDRGFAELENENPDKAEATYRKLIELVADEPLGHGNLAIALLRQQKYDDALAVIENALQLAPNRPDLLAIRSEIRQWMGDLEGALVDLDQASQAAPDDLEILYAAYSAAGTLRTPEADPVAGRVLRRLVELRPENLVVLLQLGQRAIADGDRALASTVFLRVEELLWQVQPIAFRALDMVKKGLEADDLSSARVPAVRLENVLKVSAMFRESLRELKTGIQGIPIRRFAEEPPPSDFGPPAEISLLGRQMDARPGAGKALGTGDFDGDSRADLCRIRIDGTLEIRLAAKTWDITSEMPAPGFDRLLVSDIDNNGTLDILGFSPKTGRVWLGQGDGTFARAQDDLGLGHAGARGHEVVDFDIEGDLDLVLVGGASGPADLYRNSLLGPLERVGTQSLPRLPNSAAESVFASDLDRDGDLDLLVAHARGIQWLDNLRQGRFVDRTASAGVQPAAPMRSAVAVDLDQDGFPDVVAAGPGLRIWRNQESPDDRRRLVPITLDGLPSDGDFHQVIAADLDNDGRQDLVLIGPGGPTAFGQTPDGGFLALPFSIEKGPAGKAGQSPQKTESYPPMPPPLSVQVSAVVSADLDGDGDLDLVTSDAAGLHRYENRGGDQNRWLALRLRGLDKGSSKNNFYGVGSLVEVRTGQAYQFHEARGDVLHIGLGKQAQADSVRVVWTNGVPQNRLDLKGNQQLVEEQLLKGSCPFLYAWDCEKYAFVTDLLWGAPLGLPAAPGVWVGSDPSELVRVDGLKQDRGRYSLRITEELWEAAFFDKVRLWVVDHPEDVETASNLRIVPGPAGAELADDDDRVLGSRQLRPVHRAWDGRGREVTQRVQKRDEIYADGYHPSPYQGVAEPWTFTFELGETPTRPVRLHMDGWIFPADASLNLAVAQRDDFPYLPPPLEVETADGWQTLIENMGFPPGKTKTMVIDLPALPDGASKLRMVTSLWLHWDRIAWTTETADDELTVVQRLAPGTADLRFRGFSKVVRQAPNAPHSFDYQQTRLESPWIVFAGNYTRFGDVRPLLETVDDFSVILAPGDEIALEFDASGLQPPPEGFRRTLYLESHGWDKDADRNTWEAPQLEPLPFHAMSGYPYGEGESYPDTEQHRRYRAEWLTRRIDG